MSTNAVDWSTLSPDPASAASVAAVGALAAGFDPQVPTVLLPVRVETRFTTTEIPDSTDHLAELLGRLARVAGELERLAGLPFATSPTGTVRERKRYKRTVEESLYEATQATLDAIAGDLGELRYALDEPITSGSPAQIRELQVVIAGLRRHGSAARTAITKLRSDHQRARFATVLVEQLAAAETVFEIITTRVEPALTLVADLDIRTGARAAQEIGRTSDGRLLRPDLRPTGETSARARPGVPSARSTAGPLRRVVLADGTSAEALGARRVARLERSQLVASAEALDLVRHRLSDPTGELGPDVRAAAATIVMLPGRRKAELLAALDVAAGRAGAAELRAEIAATPSDRPDLDVMVPERAAGTVWTLAGPSRTVHQLLVRIYPEPLAVDSHEEALTTTEGADGENFWSEMAAAGTDEQLRKGAWRALCIGRSTKRAAWVARAAEPIGAGHTAGATQAKAIIDAITVVAKRLAELDGGPDPRAPGERRARRPVRRPSTQLTDRQLAAVARALEAGRSRVEATESLPAISISSITARLRTLGAMVDGLSETFTNVPAEWSKLLATAERRAAALRVEEQPRAGSPDVGSRSGTWTRAASSTVLPTRFAVFAITDGKAGKVAAGKRISADLRLGVDPVADTFSLDDDGNLIMPDSIRWMTDHEEAEAKGMALRLTLTPQEADQGFDELLVLGLADGDAADGSERLTAMFDAHHYTGEGLSLLPVGTATNNTEDEAAGHSSSDDADRAFDVEVGADLTAAGADSDGLRLASALGVDPLVFAHVGGAGGTDAHDAQVANRALYPGTIGHALEELAPGLISRDARSRLRTFALADVSARGFLPAIRVDDQPYGLLPAVALSRFQPDQRDTGLGMGPAPLRAAQRRFDETLVGLFRQLHRDWSSIRQGLDEGPAVKHAHSPEIGRAGFDAQQHFLAMLGLEPSSVEASYRFAVNVADRGGLRGEPDLGLSFGIPPVDGSAVNAAAAFGPFALMEHLADVFRTAHGLPSDVAPRDPGTGLASAVWEPLYERLRTARAYELRMLNGLRPLRGVVALGGPPSTGSWILTLLRTTLEDLRARTEEDLSNVGLSEMIVRQALLAEARRAAADVLVARGLLTEEALATVGTSSLYQTWSAGLLSRTSAWGLLFSTVDHVVGMSDASITVPGDLAGRTMSTVIQANPPAAVAAHRAAVDAVARMPAERMTALTREHLDLASYRLDAWIGGLAHRRLRTMRTNRPRGAQVGAYGWVENLRRKPTTPAASGVPAALAGLPGRPLTQDPTGEGFIQTPSPTHAVTAAVLRAGYRSQTSQGSLGNEMSVNLSSNRVRVALSLIDGVRAGNDLGALLGYRLERFLHEYYARPDTPHSVELDAAIFPLRRAYPTVAAVDPTVAVAEPTRYVVDGLALVRAILDWVETNAATGTGTLFQTLMGRLGSHPWGTKPAALPPTSQMDRLIGVLRGIDSIADALDALADLTMSETVHQLVRGNHTRAAAVLTALSEGTSIPHPEVTDTPRSGLPMSHKLFLQMPAVAADSVVAPAGWETVAMTPRGDVEPSVNAWLAGLLGDPAAIRIRLASDLLAPGAALPEASVAQLGLQPLDLVALLADGFDSALASLTARVLDLLRPPDLPPDQPGVAVADGLQTTATDTWRIESSRAPAWGRDILSITDVAPLLETCVDLLGRAKPALASDVAAPEVTEIAGDGIDVDDLSIRVGRLLARARADVLTLGRLLAENPALDVTVLDGDPAVWLGGMRTRRPDDLGTEHPSAWLPVLDITNGSMGEVAESLARLDGFWGDREAWREAAAAAQVYGVRVGLPRRFLSRIQVSTELLQSAEVAFLDLATRCRDAAAALDAAADPTPAATWVDVARALLGEGLTLVPRIVLDPVRSDLLAALDAHLVDADELDAWVEGAAAVRPGAADLADLQVLTEALGRAPVTGSVAQLPHVAGDPWLGGPIPDPTALTGTVSVVVYGAEHLPVAGASGALLLVDEWSESVPFREEVTGVALHYDQPDATAPQAILVAVPPVLGAPWTLTDFAATLHDTLEVARNRTVEVEHVGASRYGQLLPLLIGEVVPNAARSAVTGDRVILDFHQNNP